MAMYTSLNSMCAFCVCGLPIQLARNVHLWGYAGPFTAMPSILAKTLASTRAALLQAQERHRLARPIKRSPN